MASDRIVIYKVFVILNLTFVYMSNVFGNDNSISLENLKRLCYPGEYNRKDMLYITVETSKIDAYLDVLASKSVQNLHLSVIPSLDNWVVDLDNIHHFHNLTELWIVRDISSQALKMTLKYGDTLEKTNIQRLHLKFLYDSLIDYGSLHRFLSGMPYLQVLELNGLRYSGDSLSIMSALHNKNYLTVLKLNQFLTIMSDNTAFTPEIFFKPLLNSSVMCLEVCDNYIVDFKPGLFDVLPDIRILNLSQNLATGFDTNYSLAEVLLNPTIEILNMSSQGYNGNRFKRSKRYTPAQNSASKSNTTEDCRDLIVFALVNQSRFAYCEVVKCLLSDRYFPCSVIPKHLDVSGLVDFNCISHVKCPLGPNFKAIIADGINFSRNQYAFSSLTYPLCFAENKIEYFSFAKNAMYLKQIPNIFNFKVIGLNSLNHLNLSHNDIIIFPSCQLLRHLPNLHSLYIQGNRIQFESNSTDSICTFLPKLTRLDMSSSGISIIPEEFFSACGHTKMWLNLEKNLITGTELSVSIKALLRITHLNLGNNKIRMFNKQSRSSLLNHKGPRVNMHLGGNPFICNCSEDSLESIKLFQSSANKMITFVGLETYQCQQYYTGTTFQRIMDVDMDKVEELCHPKYVSPYSIAVTVICFLMLVLLVSFLTYKYRFYFLTCFYKCKMKIYCHKKRKDTYLYDIFIAYCSEDRKWVHNFLMKTLENKYNFKLCIHLRYVYKLN